MALFATIPTRLDASSLKWHRDSLGPLPWLDRKRGLHGIVVTAMVFAERRSPRTSAGDVSVLIAPRRCL
jgi:hypothetical protein